MNICAYGAKSPSYHPRLRVIFYYLILLIINKIYIIEDEEVSSMLFHWQNRSNQF